MAVSLMTINTGSSSLKAALYHVDTTERLDLTAKAERIGLSGSQLRIADAKGATVLDQRGDLPDHDAAVRALFAWLRAQQLDQDLDAVGHRVVHGGRQYREPHLITDALIGAIEALVAIDPEHLPQALGAIRAARQAYPGIPQAACFDTAFHRQMPRIAQIYALPRALQDDGVIRYGFHGLSYEYILSALRALDPAAADGRVIIAHLGNGASLAAVQGGIGVETTMGFTPTGGLVMGTRPGDLDPGVLLYLLRTRSMSPDALSELVNQKAGLLGVSGISADMHDLLEKERTNPPAAEAIALFCYQARKSLSALVAVLGGLDTLVFTAGIGEHAAPIRQRICDGLNFLGITLDPGRNAAHAPVISRDGSRVTVRVIATDEDLMIARHTYQLAFRQGGSEG